MRTTILCLLLAASAIPTFAQQVGDTVVVVAEEAANLKEGSRVVAEVRRGNHLRVVEINDDWYWVVWMGREKGWISRRDVLSLDRALDYFTGAIRRNPPALDYWARGILWRKKGELGNAIEDLNEAVRRNPTYISAYNTRGNTWADKGEYDRAMADFNEAIQLDPGLFSAYVNRAFAWGGKGEYDKAIADCNEAIRLNPKSADAYNCRGSSWLFKGEYRKAIADCSDALRLNPKSARSYLCRSRAHAKLGEHEKAAADRREYERLQSQ